LNKKLKVLGVLLLPMIMIGLIGCSASNDDGEYSVTKNKKVKQEEVASITGIQKKSLIEQSNLETLTNIVS
jgi:hypothetical protein